MAHKRILVSQVTIGDVIELDLGHESNDRYRVPCTVLQIEEQHQLFGGTVVSFYVKPMGLARYRMPPLEPTTEVLLMSRGRAT